MTFEEWWGKDSEHSYRGLPTTKQIAEAAWNTGYEAGKSERTLPKDELRDDAIGAFSNEPAEPDPVMDILTEAMTKPGVAEICSTLNRGNAAAPPSQESFNDLRPCPFCGDQPIFEDVGDYYVQCPSCGAQGSLGLSDGLSHAAEAWNKRITPPDAAAQIAELKAEMDSWRRVCERLQRESDEKQEQIAKLEEQLAEARKDAERYRWLCNWLLTVQPSDEVFAEAVRKTKSLDEFDAAIDAAMEQSK